MSTLSEAPVIVAHPDYGAAVDIPGDSYQTSDLIASSNISGSRSLVGMDWESLPASKVKVMPFILFLVENIFGSDATKKAVLDSIDSPLILHIATHAYYAAEEELGLVMEYVILLPTHFFVLVLFWLEPTTGK